MQIALQMLTGDEKREVKKLIDCMLTYGVTYKQSKGDASMNGFDGSKSVLEPPLQTLIMFQVDLTAQMHTLSLFRSDLWL